MSNKLRSDSKILRRLMFRLLPIQILLMAIPAMNSIVSSYFATNFIGVNAMSAVGLYSPISILLSAFSNLLVSGSTVLCGKYAGMNEHGRLQNVFSLNIALAVIASAIVSAVFLILGVFDLTGSFSGDAAVRPLFNRYLVGSALGVLPMILGSQFPTYLAMENRNNRTTVASISYVLTNFVLNWLFVCRMHMDTLGLSLAASIGLWVFLAVVAAPFAAGKSSVKLTFRNIDWRETAGMTKIGMPGASTYLFQAVRGMLVNHLLIVYVGSVGVSAFAAANNSMMLFWAIPTGMLIVSRLMMSVSIGEEDRQSLKDIFGILFKYFVPIQCAVSAGIMLCAIPLTGIFFKDPAEPVYMMTVWGLILLPVCMPFGLIGMHVMGYGQATDRTMYTTLLAFIDGTVIVPLFAAILIPSMGIKGIYYANVINGFASIIYPVVYAWVVNRRFPRSFDDLLMLPPDFGASADERMDITLHDMDEVTNISERIQSFCAQKGIDSRRSYLSGLAMEEMAGNIVEHGFTKDNRKHTIDVRVVHKNDDIILRLRDDCVAFDPETRSRIADDEDPVSNIGIRMVFKMASDVNYQNIMGLNVLTIRI